VPHEEKDHRYLTSNSAASRVVGCNILDEVLKSKKPLDIVLEQSTEFKTLAGRDRSFCRMIVSTALRRKGQIDFLIRKASDNNSLPDVSYIANILRVSCAQIAFMNVPDYATVNEAVNIAESKNYKQFKAYINAVLRKISQNYKEWLQKQDEVTANIPDWLLKEWIKDYGLSEAAKIGQASLCEAPLDITLKSMEESKYWEGTLSAKTLPTGTLRVGSQGVITELEGFKEGHWWVQDAAAAIPVALFGDVRGEKVVDLCAAPGGKTAQLASLGAMVVAVDRSTARLQRLKENLVRLNLVSSVEIETADSTVWFPKKKVGFVLLDAPCTATGTIRRNPDLLHNKSFKDMERLISIQERLIDNALNMLAPNGILLYCTCSIQKSEGEDIINQLIDRRSDIKRCPIDSKEFGGANDMITEDGDLRVFPYHFAAYGGIDGFYCSRLEKII
jgi:16S rRNA (cytosine967-C5)-methyltransferase